MKILVTGASGFIGSHCCEQLSALGYEVHAVSSKPRTDKSVQWHEVDLLDSQQIVKLINTLQPTHLLHLAWYTEPGKYWSSIKNFHWVKASLSLFEEFYKFGGKRIVVSGSCAEYNWEYEKYYEEITPLEPRTVYGTCKHSLQLMLSAYSTIKKLSFAWGRVFSIYGPYEHPDRLCASVIQALLRGHNIKCSNGALIRDYLHVSDVASAFVALLVSDIQGTVNIGSGFGIKLRDIVEKIEEKIGNDGLLEIFDGSRSLNEAPIIVADITHLDNIGWKPFYNIESGLDHTIDWFRKK
jgi:nucleoside-diphosphate-sugar epimerase